MPKIVMVNTVPSGSHGRLMLDLQRAAAANGFEAHVAVGRSARAGQIRIGSRRDIALHGLCTRALDAHGRCSRRATEALVESLRTLRPDILHLHNLHGYYLHIETLFRFIRESRVPAIWTLHDAWALTGHCSHFMRIGCERWQTGCHDCPLKREYPASFGLDASRRNWSVKREAYRDQPKLVVASPARWLCDALSQSILRGSERVVIPNGIDLSLFRPSCDPSVRERFGVREGQAMLLSVAAPFDERKGFSDALAVAGALGDRARLVMVGLAEKQLRGLPRNVAGLLRTDGPEALVSLYGAADCLLNPTYEDTYPTVNMEALACGTPVAAYRAGGCPEQLRQGVGITVAPKDTRALAEAAMALAAKKREIGGACRAEAEHNFDRRNAIDAYLALYKSMTGA